MIQNWKVADNLLIGNKQDEALISCLIKRHTMTTYLVIKFFIYIMLPTMIKQQLNLSALYNN